MIKHNCRAMQEVSLGYVIVIVETKTKSSKDYIELLVSFGSHICSQIQAVQSTGNFYCLCVLYA